MIYLDNASTTPILEEVAKAMCESMLSDYGNPSSTHSLGRKAKVIVENVRNTIAQTLNCKAKEIIFTSGGTEADNSVINSAIEILGIERIISSKLEHHAVLDCVESAANAKLIEVVWIKNDEFGNLDLNQLDSLLQDGKKSLVSIMHVNNETGNINDIYQIADICKQYGAYFHSDTTQSYTHHHYDLSELNLHFMCASAHKFGGPKGVGFLYKKEGVPFAKQMLGGEQERNFRAGTENVHSILGMGKAVEIAFRNMAQRRKHFEDLKSYFIEKTENLNIDFIANSKDLSKSSSRIANIKLKQTKANQLLVFNFDMAGFAISEGSACSSGRNTGSHVLRELNQGKDLGQNIRISFGIQNNKTEIDSFVAELESYLKRNQLQ